MDTEEGMAKLVGKLADSMGGEDKLLELVRKPASSQPAQSTALNSLMSTVRNAETHSAMSSLMAGPVPVPAPQQSSMSFGMPQGRVR